MRLANKNQVIRSFLSSDNSDAEYTFNIISVYSNSENFKSNSIAQFNN